MSLDQLYLDKRTYEFFADGIHFGTETCTPEYAEDYAKRLKLTYNEVQDV